MDTTTAQKRKRTVSLPLPIDRAAAAAAQSAGVTVSEWIAVVAASALPVSDALPSDSPEGGSTQRLHLRVPRTELCRWRAEARSLGLSLNRYLAMQMSFTIDEQRRITTAVQTLRDANSAVAALGRNLNQLARSWNTYPGQSTAAERKRLADCCDRVDAFSERVAALVALIGRRFRPARTAKGAETRGESE